MEKKNDNKKISVILPVYNGERYLAEALESILGQTYTNIELIVVDDCSTDCTGEIIQKYSERDRRVRYIKNAVNLKLPRTLNVGFSNATGDYLTWTSDDNRYKPEALERMAYWLESKPDIDMVYADYTGVDSEGKITCEKKMGEPSEMPFHNVVGACFLYRKEVADRAGQYVYSTMRSRAERTRFLETLEDRAVNLDKRKVQRQICCVCPWYRWHVFYRGVKYRVGLAVGKLKEKQN